jgi:hypothetical protein
VPRETRWDSEAVIVVAESRQVISAWWVEKGKIWVVGSVS